jgi:predicted transposase YbfD/YdcC
MVSAFAARQRLVLGQVKVAKKSNEIVAIEMTAFEGAIVTIDAMGCQRPEPLTVKQRQSVVRLSTSSQ